MIDSGTALGFYCLYLYIYQAGYSYITVSYLLSIKILQEVQQLSHLERTISITGDLSYTSPVFDGSNNITAAGTLATVNSKCWSLWKCY